MIRHSSSFIFSIIVHTVLFSLVLFLYNNYIKKKEIINCEKRVCVKLCDIQCEKKIEPIKDKPKMPSSKSKPKLPVKPNVAKKKIVEKKIIPKKLVKIQKPKTVVKKITEKKQEVIKVETKPVKIKEEIQEELQVVSVEPEVLSTVEDLVPSSQELTKEYIQNYIVQIVKLLQENLYYPRRARKKGITGEVMVKFTIGVDSKVSNVKVLKSNKDILSRAAVKTIQDLSGEFPRPDEELSISVPISYKLID